MQWLGDNHMSRIIKPNFEHKDQRGVLREVVRGKQWKQLNEYERKKGSIVGNHYHKKLEEFFYIIRGKAQVRIENITTGKTEDFIVSAGEAFNVSINEVHALKFLEGTIFIPILSKDFDENNPDIYDKVILDG